jgi:hypothetical protein
MTEYLNDPPLYYKGNSMKCLMKTKHSPKKEYRFLGRCMDRYCNNAAKLFSGTLFVQLIVTCLYMTEENIEDIARRSLLLAVFECQFKGWAKNCIPKFFLYAEGKSVDR